MRRIVWVLSPDAGLFIEFQLHDLSAGGAAAADELNLQSPRRICRLPEFAAANGGDRGTPWRHFPLHVGPGGLAAKVRRAQEQPQRTAGFGGKLQAAEVANIQPVPRSPNRCDASAAQSLIESPQGIRFSRRPQHESPATGRFPRQPPRVGRNVPRLRLRARVGQSRTISARPSRQASRAAARASVPAPLPAAEARYSTRVPRRSPPAGSNRSRAGEPMETGRSSSGE